MLLILISCSRSRANLFSCFWRRRCRLLRTPWKRPSQLDLFKSRPYLFLWLFLDHFNDIHIYFWFSIGLFELVYVVKSQIRTNRVSHVLQCLDSQLFNIRWWGSSSCHEHCFCRLDIIENSMLLSYLFLYFPGCFQLRFDSLDSWINQSWLDHRYVICVLCIWRRKRNSLSCNCHVVS